MHHVISQTRRPDLKMNQGNLVELCKGCHDETTASLVWKHLNERRQTRRNYGDGDSSEDEYYGVGGDVCFRCGRSGHWASDCFAKTDRSGRYIGYDDDSDSDSDGWSSDDYY